MSGRNKSDIPAQAFLMAAAVIIAVLVVSMMLSQYSESKRLNSLIAQNILDATNNIIDNEIMQYDGETVRGSDVINFYKKNVKSGDYAFEMTVKNGSGTSVSYRYDKTDTGNIDKLREWLRQMNSSDDSAHYIGPLDNYSCTVAQNDNGIITEVVFEIEH